MPDDLGLIRFFFVWKLLEVQFHCFIPRNWFNAYPWWRVEHVFIFHLRYLFIVMSFLIALCFLLAFSCYYHTHADTKSDRFGHSLVRVCFCSTLLIRSKALGRYFNASTQNQQTHAVRQTLSLSHSRFCGMLLFVSDKYCSHCCCTYVADLRRRQKIQAAGLLLLFAAQRRRRRKPQAKIVELYCVVALCFSLFFAAALLHPKRTAFPLVVWFVRYVSTLLLAP